MGGWRLEKNRHFGRAILADTEWAETLFFSLVVTCALTSSCTSQEERKREDP